VNHKKLLLQQKISQIDKIKESHMISHMIKSHVVATGPKSGIVLRQQARGQWHGKVDLVKRK
jgi:hypothetical protein